MLKRLAVNCGILFAVAVAACGIHVVVNSFVEQPVVVKEIIYSYTVNALLACIVVLLLFVLKRKLKDQLGFVFMLASMLKFVFFFILFYPRYHADGDLSRVEFLIFFIPYVICLITESIILSKFLNTLDNYK
ncbi:hypothetical protein KFZ70_05575 [Tamlana fucoidanivorans]|uniref:Uncharacterized protein n=1 Tax=Allotamlana fucoidanivorans TaxID=2583814 RepID=A0A5C4SRP2_9FLAO|nr:DUF6168 family protein [Tamlana fucoidanivorans]TNJ47022.1 hypothetical protein FGF67_00400 [Tamlana fucoidanivorans]